MSYTVLNEGDCISCPTPTKQIISNASKTRFCLACGSTMNLKTGDAIEEIRRSGVEPRPKFSLIHEMDRSRTIPSKLLQFVTAMSIELERNARKGDWNDQKDIKTIATEIDKHNDKLMDAILSRDRPRILEYTADCANYYMFIANKYKLLG